MVGKMKHLSLSGVKEKISGQERESEILALQHQRPVFTRKPSSARNIVKTNPEK